MVLVQTNYLNKERPRMVKRIPKSRAPQAKHSKKSCPSQFDKASRLHSSNANRRRTTAASIPLVGSFAVLVGELFKYVDVRIAFRLPIIVAGLLLSKGRRTASRWFIEAGVKDDWDRFYDCLIHVGKKSKCISWNLLMIICNKFRLSDASTIRIVIDDSPSKRYGKHVEGAGIHHNPTAGPAGNEWVYGHSWVTLAFVAFHAHCGSIALPIRSLLYVRKQDIPSLQTRTDWKFQTKHELASELIRWFSSSMRPRLRSDCQIQLVMDGAYVSKSIISEATKLNMTVISRLRKDARLYSVPTDSGEVKRGRPRIYGETAISLTKRAASNGGWQKVSYRVRHKVVEREYKCFQATSHIVGGIIKVVIVRYEDGSWAPYFTTNPNLEVKEILEAIGDRWSIEESFHDLKEVWGAGQQQVRNVWSSIGCWNLILWMHTLVHIDSWSESESHLVDRSNRPWDNPDRRPSVSDRIRRITRKMLDGKLNAGLHKRTRTTKIYECLVDLVYRLAA